MSTIELAELPDNIRKQIEDLHKPKKDQFPICPREFSTDNFQTKEIKELGSKLDEALEAINTLYKLITEDKKNGDSHKNTKSS